MEKLMAVQGRRCQVIDRANPHQRRLIEPPCLQRLCPHRKTKSSFRVHNKTVRPCGCHGAVHLPTPASTPQAPRVRVAPDPDAGDLTHRDNPATRAAGASGNSPMQKLGAKRQQQQQPWPPDGETTRLDALARPCEQTNVFMAEFFNPTKEKADDSVHINDIEARVFEALLHFGH
ncbi:hypothetical protein HU200_007960 [Digitaria exilis]|uniref:Uncharacterized protein n=1 Tax=Digitaria exilis TaxID=1010633 RepID=A0A835FMG6_9POAL|nr:hypothetical protein HU200_007960 [Digitaria exilis]